MTTQIDKKFVQRNQALKELRQNLADYYFEPLKLLCDEYNARIIRLFKSEIVYAEKVCGYMENMPQEKIDAEKLGKALVKLDDDGKARVALTAELDLKYFSLRDNLYKQFEQAAKKLFRDFENLFGGDEILKKEYIDDSLREYKEFDMEIESIIDGNIPKFIDNRQFGKLNKVIEELYIKILRFKQDLEHKHLLKKHS